MENMFLLSWLGEGDGYYREVFQLGIGQVVGKPANSGLSKSRDFILSPVSLWWLLLSPALSFCCSVITATVRKNEEWVWKTQLAESSKGAGGGCVGGGDEVIKPCLVTTTMEL